MKTYNGQTISKKNIQSVLRTMDATQIFRLVHIIFGGKVERSKVCNFIHDFAPSDKVARNAYWIAYASKQKKESQEMVRASIAFRSHNKKHIAIDELRKEMSRKQDSYTKRPIMGHTHLYFASPVYQHSDYNKWQAIEIKGNERFCQLMVAVADKHFNK